LVEEQAVILAVKVAQVKGVEVVRAQVVQARSLVLYS
jgi:hypothetical protein